MAQVNVVVPAHHAELVRRVGKGLRQGDDFADALRRFLDGEAGIPGAVRQTLAQQVANAALAAVTPMLADPGRTAAEVAAPIAGEPDGSTAPRRPSPRKPPAGQFDMKL